MTNTLHANKAGLALGGLLALWHFVWSLLVAFGWAQWLIDWIFELHRIQPPYIILPFSLGMAVGLIIVTFVIGYIFGYVFALIWNAIQK